MATVLPSASLPQHQPDCSKDGETLLFDCGNWEVSLIILNHFILKSCKVSGSWWVPSTAVSGVYLARLVRLDTPRPSWRADGSRYPADSRFAFPDDESGELPRPPG